MQPLDLEDVSQETLEKLRLYHALLLKWQQKINLISPNTVPDAWDRHFVDSAQIAPLIGTDVKTIADLGSGAGFAGLVVAILRPDIYVTMIESDAKKCAFLQTVSRETGVPVTVVNERIERASAHVSAPDLVMARALAALPALLEYAKPWLECRPGLRTIFPKGAQFQGEIDEAHRCGWSFSCDIVPSRTDAQARILCLSALSKA